MTHADIYDALECATVRVRAARTEVARAESELAAATAALAAAFEAVRAADEAARRRRACEGMPGHRPGHAMTPPTDHTEVA